MGRNIVLLLIAFIFSGIFSLKGLCAVPTISLTACIDTASENNGPPYTKTFQQSCTVNVNPNGNSNVMVAVYALGTTTSRISGNGNDLSYTSLDRFKVVGPLQSGFPVSVPTAESTAATVQNNINTSTSFPVTTTYTTYEADLGDTTYTQNYVVAVFDNVGSPFGSAASGLMSFTIPNKAFINVIGAPSISFTNSAEVLNPFQTKESNTITVQVRANNTWLLQSKLDQAPYDGIVDQNIDISNNAFKVSGNGFTNLASVYTPFSLVDTYYNAAQSTGFTTGTVDNRSLLYKDVIFTFRVENNPIPYTKGSYSSQVTFYIQNPY